MSVPRIEHPTDRPNFSIVHIDGGLSYAFSYATCVGFNPWDGHGWHLRYNAWGPTTGKHLNYFHRNGESVAQHYDKDEFEQALAVAENVNALDRARARAKGVTA